MKSNKHTFTDQTYAVLNAIKNVKHIRALTPNNSLDTLVNMLIDCPPELKGDLISILRLKVGDTEFGFILTAMRYKKFETSVNGLAKGKKLDFEDKGVEFILKDTNHAILKGLSKDSADTLSKAFDYLEKRLHKQDPLQIMTLMNKLVASEFGQNVLTKNSELLKKYQGIRDQIVQAIADALHTRAANIFNKITKEELLNIKGYLEPKQCPNLVAMDTYISGLTLIIVEIILGNNELDVRTLQLHDLIAVGEKLIKSNSFNAFLGIFVALSTTSIHRLKNTWEGLSDSDKKIFNDFDLLMDPRGNKVALRLEQDSRIGTKVQWQLPIIKSDLIYARETNHKDEAFKKVIEPTISKFFKEQPCDIVEQYKNYDRLELHLCVQECEKKIKQFHSVSMILEPRKKDETPVGSKIISNLTSGNFITILVKSVYTKTSSLQILSPRSRASSASEKPIIKEIVETKKLSYFKELLLHIKKPDNKRKSEYFNTESSWQPLFHKRTKSLEPTPDNLPLSTWNVLDGYKK